MSKRFESAQVLVDCSFSLLHRRILGFLGPNGAARGAARHPSRRHRRAQHVEAYLNEFVFRFNRRRSSTRGLLFYRVLQNGVVMQKLDYDTIVLSRRRQAGKRRRPQPKPLTKRAPKGHAAMMAKERQQRTVSGRARVSWRSRAGQP